MGLFFQGCGNDFSRGQADAIVMDIHAAIPRAGGDLFSTVRMAIKAGFAHQELKGPPEFGGYGLYRFADRLQPFGAV